MKWTPFVVDHFLASYENLIVFDFHQAYEPTDMESEEDSDDESEYSEASEDDSDESEGT